MASVSFVKFEEVLNFVDSFGHDIHVRFVEDSVEPPRTFIVEVSSVGGHLSCKTMSAGGWTDREFDQLFKDFAINHFLKKDNQITKGNKLLVDKPR